MSDFGKTLIFFGLVFDSRRRDLYLSPASCHGWEICRATSRSSASALLSISRSPPVSSSALLFRLSFIFLDDKICLVFNALAQRSRWKPLIPPKLIEKNRKREETKRRKREGIVILVTALMVAALIFFEVQLPDVSPESSLGSNILFFVLINVNIILLGLAGFPGRAQSGQAGR